MPSLLFIRLLAPAQPSAAGYALDCQWLLLNGADAPLHGHAGQEGLRKLAEGADDLPALASPQVTVVGLVPNAHVLCLQSQVPGRRPGQMRQALPYVVEEFVATDIDGLHIACGPVRSGAPVRCCLIAKPLLDGWLACLKSVGLPPAHLVPESELLPAEPDCASVMLDDEIALIRSGGKAAAVDRPNLGAVLGMLEGLSVRFVNDAPTDFERSQMAEDVAVDAHNGAAKDAMLYFAERWRQRGAAIDLLQGNYKPVTARASNAPRWRSIAALSAVWLLLVLGGVAAKGWWMSDRADALEDEALALYQGIFPRDRTVTLQSLRRRLQARLGAQATDAAHTSLVDYMGHLAAVVSPAMRLAGLNYNEARGEFNADLLVPQYADVDLVREALAQRRLTAEVASAEQVEEGVRARFRVRAP